MNLGQLCEGKKICLVCLVFTKLQNLDSSKLKEFADNIFRFNENCRTFSKKVENTLEKGEIACHEQFLLFTQYFQIVLQSNKNMSLFEKGLGLLLNVKILD